MTFAGDNTFIVDQKFTIQDISSFGLDSSEEIIGLKCYEQIFASNSPCKNCPVPRALKAGISVESRIQEIAHKKARKSRRIKAIPLHCNNSSTQLCIVNCFQNEDSTVLDRIGSIRRNKKLNITSKSKLNIIKDLPMLAVLIDSDMNVHDYNQNADKIMNMDGISGPLTTKTFPHISCSEFRTKFGSFCKIGVEEGSFTIQDENSFYRHTVKKVLIDDDKTVFLVLSDDLHDVFKTDLVPEKNPYNTMEILSELEHDLKNPLNVILIEMQELEKLGNSQQEGKEKAQSVINQLEIINDYFDRIRLLQPFSKGEMDFVDFEAIVKNAITLVKMQMSCPDVNFEFSCQVNLPPLFCCEYNLQQAIQQILINAVEAMGSTGIVEINLKYENDWFTCTVTDFGIGFHKELEKKVFDVFFTTKKERKAIGVGLSIAHSVIYNHSGTIELTSEENIGTTVSIRLPGKNSGNIN